MKTEIFNSAICNRNPIRFLYGLNEVVMDPYYITEERGGKKVIYGRMNSTSEIKKFEYNRIANIRIFKHTRFSPIIPILN